MAYIFAAVGVRAIALQETHNKPPENITEIAWKSIIVAKFTVHIEELSRVIVNMFDGHFTLPKVLTGHQKPAQRHNDLGVAFEIT